VDELLRAAPLFAGVAEDDWAALAGSFTKRALTRGEAVFREGEDGRELYVVLTGKVKLGRHSADGRENVIAVLGPGDLFGELSLFDDTTRAASATAVTETELAALDHAAFDRWLTERPAVSRVILRVLARRLRMANESLSDLVFADVPGRVAKALLGLADRFGTSEADGAVRVEHDLTQEELAQLVGASRETVNKALSDFATRGWLRLDGRAVVLIDAERLARRAH
jgi:CRP/FNR family transcriptional regulator, cyclic AMP receptor protein